MKTNGPLTVPGAQNALHTDQASGATSYKGLVVAFFYGGCSISMAFANKAVMNTYSFNYPFFLILAQMAFTVLLLESLRGLRQISLLSYTFARGWQFLLTSSLYAVHSVLALTALSGMNIAMYGMVKRCAPMAILLLGMVILKKGPPSCLVALSVTMVTVGCVVAGYGDLAFDPEAYIYGGLSVLTQATYLLLVQRAGQNLSTTETLHINSYNTLPLLFICSIVFGDFFQAIRHFDVTNIGFIITFSIVIGMGCLLNYLLFLCTSMNCALTTSITGTLKSILQTAIGLFTFGGVSVNVFTVTGIAVNLGGGVMYSYAKYKEAQSKAANSSKHAHSVLKKEESNNTGPASNATAIAHV